MFTRRLKNINSQGGFTMIELLVAIAITGLISLGLMMTIYQVMSGSVGSSNEAEVVRQVQNTGYWISRDAQMANEVVPDNDPLTPEVVTLTWYEYEWDPDSPDREGRGHKYVYRLLDGELWRDYYSSTEQYDDENEELIWVFNTEPDYTTFIAKHISEIDMNPFGSIYKLTVTAAIDGWQPESETRIYEVKPRPNVF